MSFKCVNEWYVFHFPEQLQQLNNKHFVLTEKLILKNQQISYMFTVK